MVVFKLRHPLYLRFNGSMCMCVQHGKVIGYVIMSAMYYGRQYMLRPLAVSQVESDLRNVKNDGSV